MTHRTYISFAPLMSCAALALLLFAAGCSKEEIPAVTGYPEDGVVRIAANADAPLTSSGITKGAEGTDDTAGSSVEYSGATLGLFADYGTGDKYTVSNVNWTKVPGSDWTPAITMLWKSSTSPANLYAYAPYIEGSTDATAVCFSVPADQRGGTLAADFVSWAGTGFVPNDNNNSFVDGKVLISFSHRLVKMTFNFSLGTQLDPATTTIKRVELFGTSTTVNCDITTGVVTPGADSEVISLHKVTDTQYEAIFYPGIGQNAGSKMLEIILDIPTEGEKTLNFKVPAGGLVSGGLQAGCAYNMNLRLGKDKVEISTEDGGVTVAEWTDGDDNTITGGEASIPEAWDGTTVTTAFAGGSGIESEPYLISNGAQLAYLAQQVNAGTAYSGNHFKLTADINLGGKEWTPIGKRIVNDQMNGFSGTFDGDNHKIYNLKIDSDELLVGLFGYVNNGSIKNLRVLSSNVNSTKESEESIIQNAYVGTIAGYLHKATMTNCIVSNINISGAYNVGGLVGVAEGYTIRDCHLLSGSISSSVRIAGGILANSFSVYNEDNILEDCSVKASIYVGLDKAGGLIGIMRSIPVSINNCSVKAHLSLNQTDAKKEENCGGFVGQIYNVTAGSFGSFNIHFNNCSFEGTIKGANNYNKVKGAAVGAMIQSGKTTISFTNCKYTIDQATFDFIGSYKGIRSVGGGNSVYETSYTIVDSFDF